MEREARSHEDLRTSGRAQVRIAVPPEVAQAAVADLPRTLVTETFEWHWTPFPAEGFRGRVGKMPLDEARAAVGDRARHLQDQLDATLAALERALESRA